MQPAPYRPRSPNRYNAVFMLLALLLSAGCSTPVINNVDQQTMLLVSLQDGSIIGQEIDADADICMKANESSLTTCLKRGEPVLANGAESVIGYRMEQTEIHLVPE